MKAQLIETLHTLTALHALPGFEQPVVRHLRRLRPLADEVQVDS
jgi:putative aminopeptidase FrvX